MKSFLWPLRNEFVNRTDDLEALERWWENPSRDALAMIGRRRVGKSWLFRRFADGKPALILVADRLLASSQMHRFAAQLEGELDVRPDLPDLRSLIEVLYRLGRDQKILVVIDEFPYLLPDGEAREGVLTQVQAVMEDERDQSQTKLVLCGSLIGQMEKLLGQDSPLHGRLQALDIRPLTFAEGRELREADESPEGQITRFAVAGGMARYLAELGQGGSLRDLVCEHALDPRGALFDDPRVVLEQEMRSPALPFSILEELALFPAQTERLTKALGTKANAMSPALTMLQRMRLIESKLPLGAPANARTVKHRISDGFIRFWFRFIFPSQAELEEGLSPSDLWDSLIDEHLADFVSPTFEELCIRYTRINFGTQAPKVGSWWGPAQRKHRRSGARTAEEIDVAGAKAKQLKLVGECKWTKGPLGLNVLDELRNYKVPALAEEKRLRVPKTGLEILLFSCSGFSSKLTAAAEADSTIHLIDLETLVAGLTR